MEGFWHEAVSWVECVAIEQIDLSKSKPYKDFGRGFYLSDNEEQALAMAHQKVMQLENGIETVNVYEFDENLLSDGMEA